MTPQLSLLIAACTCDRCAGEGKLVSSQSKHNRVFGFYVRETETRPCPNCDGTGIQGAGGDD